MGGRYLLSITFRRGTSLEEANKYMNALAAWLKKKMTSEMNCEILFCLSDVSGNYGRYMPNRTGRVGRPKREYIGTQNAKAIDAREPHLHILLHGAHTNYIKNCIHDHYSDRKDITDTFDRENCEYRWGSTITYVTKQGRKRRYLVTGNAIESPLRKWELEKYCKNIKNDSMEYNKMKAGGGK